MRATAIQHTTTPTLPLLTFFFSHPIPPFPLPPPSLPTSPLQVLNVHAPLGARGAAAVECNRRCSLCSPQQTNVSAPSQCDVRPCVRACVRVCVCVCACVRVCARTLLVQCVTAC